MGSSPRDPGWQCCPVCGEVLDWPRPLTSVEDRLFARCPKLLSCLHTVCEACLHDARERFGGFQCRECPARTAVGSVEAVAALSYDWTAVDGVRRAAHDAGDYTCDECAADAAAAFWCESCGVGLCGFHEKNHRKSRRTAGHRVRPLDDDDDAAEVVDGAAADLAAAGGVSGR